LVEADLASQFGVSKTPVREVLYRLEEEGLVSSARNRGFTVRVITAKEMRNIYELRELYEGACARAAACSEGRANLAALLRDYNSAAAAALAEGDIQLVHAKFSAFDDAIFAQSSNELLREQVDHISALISLGGTMSNLIPGRIPKSISQHEAIADAIGANDPTAAERLTREHIRSLFEDQLRGTAPGYASDRRTG
jgi:DNA-binding GntR family transcriptional regulator